MEMSESKYQILLRLVANAYIRQKGKEEKGTSTERSRATKKCICEYQNHGTRKGNA